MSQASDRHGDAMLAACSVCKSPIGRLCTRPVTTSGTGERTNRTAPHKVREKAGAKIRAKIKELPDGR